MRKQPFSLSCAIMRFVCIVLGIILAVMLGITVYFQSILDRIDFPQMSGTQFSNVLSQGKDTLTSLLSRDEEDPILNILLIGQDRREEDTMTRSDSMILCTFNTQTEQITMTSFLRDLYLPIPGHSENRLNAAYAYGGMELLKQTLEENFGITIHGTVEVDFTQFAQVIDLLGGVSLELRQDEADAINRAVPGELTAGTQWLTGSQALAYARIRNLDSDGDFSRTNRQRKVITALVRSYKDTSIPNILTMLDKAMPMLSTDLSRRQLLRYAVQLFPLLSGGDITSQRIPADGTYEDRTVDGMAVLVADLDAARELLRKSLAENVS